MAIRITVVSTKGGVGKTTLTANLGGILADLGQRVLLVDADIQPALSSYYLRETTAAAGLSRLVCEGQTEGAISRLELGIDIVLSDDPEGRLPTWILHTPDGRVRLKHALRGVDALYDYVLIDTQGAVGPLQDAAVLAADLLLAPIPPESLSSREFVRGTLAMLERLRPMAYLGAPLGPLYGVVYRMDRTIDARRIAQELRAESFAPSGGMVRILDSVIPSAVAWREASTARTPVHRWDPIRRTSAACAQEVMRTLVAELLPPLAPVAAAGIVTEGA